MGANLESSLNHELKFIIFQAFYNHTLGLSHIMKAKALGIEESDDESEKDDSDEETGVPPQANPRTSKAAKQTDVSDQGTEKKQPNDKDSPDGTKNSSSKSEITTKNEVAKKKEDVAKKDEEIANKKEQVANKKEEKESKREKSGEFYYQPGGCFITLGELLKWVFMVL